MLIRKLAIGAGAAGRRSPSRAGVLGAASADRLRARGGPGLLHWSTCSCRDGGLAAAHRRRAASKVEADPGRAPRASRSYNTIAGFSFFTRVTASNYALRSSSASSRGTSATAPSSTRAGHRRPRSTRELAAHAPEATRVRGRCRPAIPGIGTAGGFSMMLQDRSGGIGRVPRPERRRSSWPRRSKRPELAGVTPHLHAPACRRSSPTSTATRCSSRASRSADVYQTLQAFLGGVYVNDFNRFGRQWRVFVQAEPEYRTQPGRHVAVLRAQQRRRRWCRCRRSVDAREHRSGREFTTRFNLYRAAEIIGAAAPGYSSGQAIDALEEVARETLPPEIGYDCSERALVPGEGGSSGARPGLRAVARVRVPDPGGALRELVAAVQRAAGVPVAVFGAFARPAARGSSTSTSTRRSAWSC